MWVTRLHCWSNLRTFEHLWKWKMRVIWLALCVTHCSLTQCIPGGLCLGKLGFGLWETIASHSVIEPLNTQGNPWKTNCISSHLIETEQTAALPDDQHEHRTKWFQATYPPPPRKSPSRSSVRLGLQPPSSETAMAEQRDALHGRTCDLLRTVLQGTHGYGWFHWQWLQVFFHSAAVTPDC